MVYIVGLRLSSVSKFYVCLSLTSMSKLYSLAFSTKQHQTMDKVQKLNSFNTNTPSSEF
jgi:hypothetical protein